MDHQLTKSKGEGFHLDLELELPSASRQLPIVCRRILQPEAKIGLCRWSAAERLNIGLASFSTFNILTSAFSYHDSPNQSRSITPGYGAAIQTSE